MPAFLLGFVFELIAYLGSWNAGGGGAGLCQETHERKEMGVGRVGMRLVSAHLYHCLYVVDGWTTSSRLRRVVL